MSTAGGRDMHCRLPTTEAPWPPATPAAAMVETAGDIDGAAFSHEVLDHLQALPISRRRVRRVTGWAVNPPTSRHRTAPAERVDSPAAAAGRRTGRVWAKRLVLDE